MSRSCVLNSELPLASRLHIVEEFNKNIYDILIASDESEIVGVRAKQSDQPPSKKAKKEKKEEKEDSGVSRGIGKYHKRYHAVANANESLQISSMSLTC